MEDYYIGCFCTMSGSRYCLIRLLEEIRTDETTLLNSFDCPLINLTNIIYCVPSIPLSVILFHLYTNVLIAAKCQGGM